MLNESAFLKIAFCYFFLVCPLPPPHFIVHPFAPGPPPPPPRKKGK